MGKFLEAEKNRQIRFKNTSTSISYSAKEDGVFRGLHGHFACLKNLQLRTFFL